jgi:hypothetical protein
MLKFYNEQLDLDLVAAYFASRGLAGECFTRAETHRQNTGISYSTGRKSCRLCEVKSPKDPWLDELLDDTPPLTMVGGDRLDPTFNRLARLLSKADEQLSVVNPARFA